MKVSEAIDRLKVGDTVWVKSKVTAINFEGGYIRSENTKTSIYLDGNAEISLEETQAEKVEVPDYVAEWYEVNKGNLEFNIASAFHRIGRNTHNPQHSIYEWLNDSNNEPMQTLFKMKDGYTVKQEPKWIVKTSDGNWVNSITSNLHNSKVIDFSDNKRPSLIFLDKKTAEAVATLIDGSVEEV